MGEAQWGADGFEGSGKLSLGASVEGNATVAGYGGSAKAACTMTTNQTGGCKGGFKVEAADATLSNHGALAFGASVGIAKGEVEINVVDFIVAKVGQLVDAARGFMLTLGHIKQMTSDAPLTSDDK